VQGGEKKKGNHHQKRGKSNDSEKKERGGKFLAFQSLVCEKWGKEKGANPQRTEKKKKGKKRFSKKNEKRPRPSEAFCQKKNEEKLGKGADPESRYGRKEKPIANKGEKKRGESPGGGHRRHFIKKGKKGIQQGGRWKKRKAAEL